MSRFRTPGHNGRSVCPFDLDTNNRPEPTEQDNASALTGESAWSSEGALKPFWYRHATQAQPDATRRNRTELRSCRILSAVSERARSGLKKPGGLRAQMVYRHLRKPHSRSGTQRHGQRVRRIRDERACPRDDNRERCSRVLKTGDLDIRGFQ
jgi:hypothetical protein